MRDYLSVSEDDPAAVRVPVGSVAVDAVDQLLWGGPAAAARGGDSQVDDSVSAPDGHVADGHGVSAQDGLDEVHSPIGDLHPADGADSVVLAASEGDSSDGADGGAHRGDRVVGVGVEHVEEVGGGSAGRPVVLSQQVDDFGAVDVAGLPRVVVPLIGHRRVHVRGVAALAADVGQVPVLHGLHVVGQVAQQTVALDVRERPGEVEHCAVDGP